MSDATNIQPVKLTFPNARVLICEDDEINQDVACCMLEEYGIEPVVAGNGAEAIERLNEQPFDLVFMDILMPILNGYDAAFKIRSSEKPYNNIPIIAMTASTLAEETKRCFTEGMDGYITKPIDDEQLYKELVKWLSESGKKHTPGEKPRSQDAVTPFIDGINVIEGLRRFRNKADKYSKALKNFSAELEARIPDISHDIDSGVFSGAGAAIHKIKGVAGNLGAVRLYNSAVKLESALSDSNGVKAELRSFISESEAFFRSTDNYLRECGCAVIQNDARPKGGHEEALALFNKLLNAAKQFDPGEAEKVLMKLNEKNWDGIDESELNEIHSLSDDYRFDDVIEKINSLLTRLI